MRVLVCGAHADRQSLSAAVAAAVMIKSSGSCSDKDSIAGIRSESTYQVMLRLPSTSQLFAQTNSCKQGTDEPMIKLRIIFSFSTI
jgi:archaellin